MQQGNLTPTDVAVTAIIRRDRKLPGPSWLESEYLLLQRALDKKHWPGLWCMPGGHVEHIDWQISENVGDGIHYNVLENALRREVWEEAGIYIKNINYVVSMTFNEGTGFVLSMSADQDGDHEVVINNESAAFGWFTLEEARKLPLIDGVLAELEYFEGGRNGRFQP